MYPTDRVPETVKGQSGGDIFRADGMKEIQPHRRGLSEKEYGAKTLFFIPKLAFSGMRLGGPIRPAGNTRAF